MIGMSPRQRCGIGRQVFHKGMIQVEKERAPGWGEITGARRGAACVQEITVMWGIGAAVEVANCQGARFDGDARGGVVQIGDAGCGEGAADGRRRMQRVEGDAVGSRGADVGKIVAIGDVAAGKRLGAPQGQGERAGFLMLAAVRIVRAQALPAGVIQIDFRQGGC